MNEIEIERKVAALRAVFDETFARAVSETQNAPVNMLGVQLGEEHFLVRLSELAAFERARELVPLPDAPPELLGVVGLRGRLVPIYSLPLVLGCTDVTPHPWWLIAGKNDPVGFAVSGFAGHLQVAKDEVKPRAAGQKTHTHVHDLVCTAERTTGVLDLAAVVRDIQERANGARAHKEQL